MTINNNWTTPHLYSDSLRQMDLRYILSIGIIYACFLIATVVLNRWKDGFMSFLLEHFLRFLNI